MREFNLALVQDGQPLYLRLAEAIRLAIESERLLPGDLLPSTRRLAEMVGAHRHTVMNALAELVSEGWLEAEAGRGYRVVAGLPRYFAHDLREEVVENTGTPVFRYSFPSGQPDLRLFPTDEYYAVLREVLRKTDPRQLLGYDDPAGTTSLLAELRLYLRRMRDISGGEIVVTHGSQEGIFLLSKLLLTPGDTVAVERLGYLPAWEAMRLAGARLVGLEVDEFGLVPDSLDRLARRGRVALLYVTPLHQYPTTVTMVQERRRELYEVAQRHSVAILEDDYDHEFHYRSRPLAPLKSRDPEGIVYYTSTFSKVVYPSARLGFVVLPSQQAKRLSGLKRVTTRQSNTLLQLTQARWMESGGFERHLRRMRRTYQTRMQVMVEVLQRQSELFGVPISFQVPDGGMSLWVDFGLDTAKLSAAAGELGVLVRAGQEYDLQGRSSTHLRLGFASSNEGEIEAGLTLLIQAASSLRPKA